MKISLEKYDARASERGNVFTILLAAVALTAVLGTQIFSTLSGPIASLSRVTNNTITDTQMLAASKIVIMDAANLAASGDCDADGAIEPREWRTGAGPTGGGLIPTTIGAPVTDPWGTDYGYCVWDTGALRNNAGCGGAGQNRLEGSPNPSAGNTDTQFVIALVSAGPNRQFNTTCADYVDTTTPILTQGGDDVVYKYTYAEASVATSSLWYLQDGDPSTAEIQKDLQIGTDITVDAGAGLINALGANITGRMVAGGGVAVGDETDVVDAECSALTAGLVRYNTVSNSLEVCDGTGASGWQAAGASEGETGSLDPAGTCTVAGDAGKVRFNDTLDQPEFCNGTAWVPFALAAPTPYFEITPSSDNTMNVTGPCSGGDCPFAFSTWRTFTVRNIGNAPSGVMPMPTFDGSTGAEIEFDLANSTCDDGLNLRPFGQPGDSCVMILRARLTGNVSFKHDLIFGALNLNAWPALTLSGTGSGFPCAVGGFIAGGILTSIPGSGCTGSNPTTGSIIVQPERCGCETNEPKCSPSNYTTDCYLYITTSTPDTVPNSGTPAQYSVNAISGYLMDNYAARYCDALVLGGFSDWFLPSFAQADHMRNDSLSSTNFSFFLGQGHIIAETRNLLSSSLSQVATQLEMTAGGPSATAAVNNQGYVRCVRSHNTALPSAQADTNPEYLMFAAGISNGISFYWEGVSNTGLRGRFYANAASTTLTSYDIPMRGINQSASFTTAGSGTPMVSVNGGPFAASGTIPVGAHIRFRITTPASTGTTHTGTVQIGTDEVPVELIAYTTNPSSTKRIFVTNNTYVVAGSAPGGFNSKATADARCQDSATAASLPSASTYLAVLGTSTQAPFTAMGHFAHRFETVGGQFLANNLAELVTGNMQSTVTTETGAIVSGNNIWGGSSTLNLASAASASHCGNWTTTATNNIAVRENAAPSLWQFVSNQPCNVARRLMCVGPN